MGRLKVEVLPRHHGMSTIDDAVLSSRNLALFLDYGNKTVLLCDFTLSNSYSINWQIREIYRWDNDEEFDCMTFDDGHLVGCRSTEMFTANLSNSFIYIYILIYKRQIYKIYRLFFD